jgi:hypothetical protein
MTTPTAAFAPGDRAMLLSMRAQGTPDDLEPQGLAWARSQQPDVEFWPAAHHVYLAGQRRQLAAI